MAFSMFQAQTSPIAIDFGTSSVKLMQLAEAEERPQLVAAAELTIPDAARADEQMRREYLSEFVPSMINKAKFKGRRAIIAIPSSRTFIQHMSLASIDGASTEDLIKGQLNAQTGVSPDAIVVRHIGVGNFTRDGSNKDEVICLAMARDAVMHYISLLRKQKISVVGVHPTPNAMTHAFDHLYRREGDDAITSLYVDLGWSGTQMVITHGRQITFARHIPQGGRMLDQLIAGEMKCDLETARGKRLTLGPTAQKQASREGVPGQAMLNAAAIAHAADSGRGRGAGSAVETDRRSRAIPADFAAAVQAGRIGECDVDLSEPLDTLADEIAMGIRYHQSLFESRPVDRMILLGGEANHLWLCEHLVHRLQIPTMLGDPMSRYEWNDASLPSGMSVDDPHPGWSVACGLCQAPTDF